MLTTLFQTYSGSTAAEALQARCRAQVVRWRWATESMAFEVPFLCEEYGRPAPRWIADAKADPARHVRHGFDAEGRIIVERDRNGGVSVWLHLPDLRQQVSFYNSGSLSSITQFREADGRLQEMQQVTDDSGFTETFEWQGERLLRVLVECWGRGERTGWSQRLYDHDDDGQLQRITLEHLDRRKRRKGDAQLLYLRPRKGETLATVCAEVERRLQEAIAEALPRIARDEPLYCLLLCYTEEDVAAAWPPFLVWGRQSYREQVLARGEEVAYLLWAPDEIRQAQGESSEQWFDAPALVEACARHNQYMALRQSSASAKRLLTRVAAWLDAPAQRAQLCTTDDFVVAVADNTGAVDPLRALRRAITPERWQLLKSRGYV